LPKFPLILLLDGFRTNLEITNFKDIFAYNPNWSMRGLAYSLKQERIESSQFGTQASFIEYLAKVYPSSEFLDFEQFDEPPPDIFVIEGGLALAIHLSRERDRTLIARFKEALQSFECCVCGFDFQKAYGVLGKQFIEAHHSAPIGGGGQRETRITDLHPVCSNCHRMLHRGLGMTTEDLRSLFQKQQE
jgi:hypothetical protein